jgi:hypothetical protein
LAFYLVFDVFLSSHSEPFLDLIGFASVHSINRVDQGFNRDEAELDISTRRFPRKFGPNSSI